MALEAATLGGSPTPSSALPAVIDPAALALGQRKLGPVSIWAEIPGLSLASGGTVRLSVTPPPGVAVPQGIPASVTMTGGQANLTLTFPVAGYYRVAATGPGGGEGWATVDVGTTPATAPAQ